MGEFAEMALNGELCEICGVYLGDNDLEDGVGFPRLCATCGRDSFQEGERVRDTGLPDHEGTSTYQRLHHVGECDDEVKDIEHFDKEPDDG